MTAFVVRAIVPDGRRKIEALIPVDADSADSAVRPFRLEHKHVLAVYLADTMTEVCVLHTNPLPCETCDKLTRGEFPDSWIDLRG